MIKIIHFTKKEKQKKTNDQNDKNLNINENTYINLQIQPGDDLEWNYLNWYGNIELLSAMGSTEFVVMN